MNQFHAKRAVFWGRQARIYVFKGISSAARMYARWAVPHAVAALTDEDYREGSAADYTRAHSGATTESEE